MILESELLAMTAAQIAAAIRHRTQLLAEQAARMTREKRGGTLRELQQLRARYVYLRGGAAAVADLV